MQLGILGARRPTMFQPRDGWGLSCLLECDGTPYSEQTIIIVGGIAAAIGGGMVRRGGVMLRFTSPAHGAGSGERREGVEASGD